MPVPKRKRSRSRRDKRFANKGIKPQAFIQCPSCQEFVMPHVACKQCGHYKGAKIIATKAERSFKRSETRQAQQARVQAKEQALKAAAEQQTSEQDSQEKA